MPPPRSRWVLLAGLLTAYTAAQPLPLDLGEQSVGTAVRVFGGGECVRRRVVVEAVEAWLGRDTLPASWSVVVSVEGERAHFTIFERGKLVAVRRFDDLPDCRDFEAALGASIGLSLEALLTRRAEVEQERAEGEPSTTESEGPRERQGSPLASTLHGTFAPTTLTSPAWGGSLTFELGAPWAPGVESNVRTRLGVLSLWALPTELTEVADARLETRLMAARVGPCLGDGTRSWRLQACADLMAGYVSGRGSGAVRALGAHLPWAAVGLGVEGRLWIVEPLALSAGAQANLQVVRPVFRVVSDSGREVEELRIPSAGVMVHVGATWSYR